MTSPEGLLAATRALVEARSPSGEEGPALEVAERLLANAGMTVTRQEVGSRARWNLFAARGLPRVAMTTHLDTVPGWPEVILRGDTLQGRGACDAKGAAVAMIDAARELSERGATGFGILLVVGEETDSAGALMANAALAGGEAGWRCRRSVLGEPTDNRWVSAHPGVLMARLEARGRAAHSSQPDEAVSAIHALLDWIAAIRREPWPADPVTGPTLFQVGRIEGGTAANVVAETAAAEVMFRTGVPPARVETRLREMAPAACRVIVTCASAAMRFDEPPLEASGGEPATPVRFSTDAPFLTALGRPSLYGPGSIRHAHAGDEQVTGAELALARDRYVAWVQASLRDAQGGGDAAP